MKYTIDKKDKYCIFKLNEPKLDSTLAPTLKTELITLNAEGNKNIILDLSDVNYTDSSGLSSLLVGNRTFQQEGDCTPGLTTDHHMYSGISYPPRRTKYGWI